ncbi:MAG: phosphopantetheine-binding protein [Candidatus Cryptobacteroides sp.]
MEELIEQLKSKIIEALNLEELTPGDIDPDAPLFGDAGLGLDSIDALELILILERDYGIRISQEEGRQVFRSVRTMAEYISSKKA